MEERRQLFHVFLKLAESENSDARELRPIERAENEIEGRKKKSECQQKKICIIFCCSLCFYITDTGVLTEGTVTENISFQKNTIQLCVFGIRLKLLWNLFEASNKSQRLGVTKNMCFEIS